MDEINLFHKYLYAIRLKQIQLGMDTTHVNFLLDNMIKIYTTDLCLPDDATVDDRTRLIKMSNKIILERWKAGEAIVTEYCNRMQKEIMNGLSMKVVNIRMEEVLFGDGDMVSIIRPV